MLRWLNTVVVRDEGKASLGASGGDREGGRERIGAHPRNWAAYAIEVSSRLEH
jgi:hypothetical protein